MRPPEGTGFRIKLIHDAIRARSDARLSSQGLTLAQMRVLAYLAHAGHAAPQKELEGAFAVKHPTMTGILQRLESKGLVQSAVNAQDRRQHNISLSGRGAQLAAEIAKWPEQMEAQLLRGLSREEAAELARLLERVYRNIREDRQTDSSMKKPEDSLDD